MPKLLVWNIIKYLFPTKIFFKKNNEIFSGRSVSSLVRQTFIYSNMISVQNSPNSTLAVGANSS